jgi:CRP/FNR family transcriptional regulator
MREKVGLKVQHKCDQCEFQKDSFFCNLRETNLKILESLKITNAYPKGSTLFMQGQPSNGVFLLCQGKVKLSTASRDGKVVILHIAGPGEILGLSSAISDSEHIATADVIEPCQVNFVRNKDFLNFIETNSEACLGAAKQLSANYHTAYLQICSLGLSNSVADKLAMFFLAYCETAADDPDGAHVTIDYTHREIAQMIGTTRETVTRLLKDFKKRHLITITGSDIYIHNKDELESTIGTRPGSDSDL